MNAPLLGIMCVDRGVLVGMRHPRLGQGLSVRTLSAGLVCVVLAFPLRFAAGETGRSSTFRTLYRECSPHLPLLAGELLIRTHAAPSHIALFAHMVLSIAPAVASTSASYGGCSLTELLRSLKSELHPPNFC